MSEHDGATDPTALPSAYSRNASKLALGGVGVVLVAAGVFLFATNDGTSPATAEPSDLLPPGTMLTLHCQDCGCRWDVTPEAYMKGVRSDSQRGRLQCPQCGSGTLSKQLAGRSADDEPPSARANKTGPDGSPSRWEVPTLQYRSSSP